MEEYILNAKAIGKSDGKELNQKYRFVAYKNRYADLCIRPEQSFKGQFNEFSKLAGWTLESLKENSQDELAIDFGQNWTVSGLIEAVKEADFLFFNINC
jgi:hypothetical protein